jgi:hypothetical protein
MSRRRWWAWRTNGAFSDDLPNSSRGGGSPETRVASRLTPQEERQVLRATLGGGQRLLVWARIAQRAYYQLQQVFGNAAVPILAGDKIRVRKANQAESTMMREASKRSLEIRSE